jgi:hypothetical protein
MACHEHVTCVTWCKCRMNTYVTVFTLSCHPHIMVAPQFCGTVGTPRVS